ncbi:LysR substrate-binding domain-containing protein [Frankia sp. AgPm24]|uniref:LysR substrate-binding domain-containing protein n=1 Tax=Frankia sp. AgPm24 TaxID=631128 RepID=UPI0035B0404C
MKAGGDAGLLPAILAACECEPCSLPVRVIFRTDRGRLLRDGRADAALVYSLADDLSGLDTEPLLTEPLMAVLPATHPFAVRTSLRMADLHDENVHPQRGPSTGPEARSPTELLPLVALGQTVALVPRFVTTPLRHDLVSVPGGRRAARHAAARLARLQHVTGYRGSRTRRPRSQSGRGARPHHLINKSVEHATLPVPSPTWPATVAVSLDHRHGWRHVPVARDPEEARSWRRSRRCWMRWGSSGTGPPYGGTFHGSPSSAPSGGFASRCQSTCGTRRCSRATRSPTPKSRHSWTGSPLAGGRSATNVRS